MRVVWKEPVFLSSTSALAFGTEAGQREGRGVWHPSNFQVIIPEEPQRGTKTKHGSIRFLFSLFFY